MKVPALVERRVCGNQVNAVAVHPSEDCEVVAVIQGAVPEVGLAQ